jgi:hypothetical protein
LQNPVFLRPGFPSSAFHRESKRGTGAVCESGLTNFALLGVAQLRGIATSGPSQDKRACLRVNGFPGSETYDHRASKLRLRK